MLPDNVGYIFDVPLKVSPDRPAILQGDQVLSFAELDERCNRVANGLAKLGVNAGDRAALLIGNSIQFLETLFGVMRLGAVPVPLNSKMGDDGLAYVIADSEAVVLIASSEMAERVKLLSVPSSSLKHVILDAPSVPGAVQYEALLQAAAATLERRQTQPNEICIQPYTSGSTGRPKGVLLTHGGQIWAADAVRKAWMLDYRERALVAVPLFHKNAMAGAVKPLLLAGGSVVILPGFDAKEIIRSIARHRVTYMAGVPAMYRLLLAETELLRQSDLRSLQFALAGSAEISPELLDDFTRVFQATMMEAYGLTEGGPTPILNLRWGIAKRGSCGRAYPGCDVKIVGRDGNTELGCNEVGELITRNPGVAVGYWGLPELAKTKLRDGWLYTGDLMRRDEDGYFYFVGRKDDMINIGGENVYPKEIESVLLRHPNVASAVVVPIPHPVKNQVVVAFITERQRAATNEEEIKRFFLQNGAPYAYPRRVHFLDTMPLGGTGKIDRAALRRLAAQYEERNGNQRT